MNKRSSTQIQHNHIHRNFPFFLSQASKKKSSLVLSVKYSLRIGKLFSSFGALQSTLRKTMEAQIGESCCRPHIHVVEEKQCTWRLYFFNNSQSCNIRFIIEWKLSYTCNAIIEKAGTWAENKKSSANNKLKKILEQSSKRKRARDLATEHVPHKYSLNWEAVCAQNTMRSYMRERENNAQHTNTRLHEDDEKILRKRKAKQLWI